ncbi:MAG: hypothetical protein HYZ47_00740 [Simkania negevensis]|nr:hypothetical protein [Simkania negevensis]
MELKEFSPLSLKKYAFVFFPILALIFFFVFHLSHRKETREKDFILAKTAFAEWNEEGGKKQESLFDLQKILKKHPELAKAYEPAIAQNLLIAHQIEEALPYFQKVLKRSSQPYYTQFAQTSLTITQKKWEQALAQAISLKEELLKDESFWKEGREGNRFGSPLFAFNLLRIAFLHQEVGNKSKELETWEELKSYAGWNKTKEIPARLIGKEGFELLLSAFTMQEISLFDYIEMREKELKKG